METIPFKGKEYHLNQLGELLETDDNPINPLLRWFKESKVGEFTRYYSKIIFNTKDGFAASYADNIDDYVFI